MWDEGEAMHVAAAFHICCKGVGDLILRLPLDPGLCLSHEAALHDLVLRRLEVGPVRDIHMSTNYRHNSVEISFV